MDLSFNSNLQLWIDVNLSGDIDEINVDNWKAYWAVACLSLWIFFVGWVWTPDFIYIMHCGFNKEVHDENYISDPSVRANNIIATIPMVLTRVEKKTTNQTEPLNRIEPNEINRIIIVVCESNW